ncbi:DASH family cryptochrome [Fulvivirga lutea]|uniref:Cryptochrome DASH n=1 Tax=Fulvivirga lutea TaxID=2810512 RepID=A0A974WKV0_9BACT|nr:DASH family cryptochrome [Fulvivirga lutea]QSE98030.1 DASH family cryptochrome [Fulvivirga lutea]
MRPKALIWFRNDLRIQDNELLTKGLDQFDIYPLFIFDDRQFEKLPQLGFTKTGSFKAQFLIESVEELKSSLQSLGSDLIVRKGLPESIIPELAKELKAKKVFTSKEVTTDEVSIEDHLEDSLFKIGVDFETCWQSTLFHEEDVPWPIKQVPEVFTQFRKEAEKAVEVRPLFDTPKELNTIENIELGLIPSLTELGITEQKFDKRSVVKFKGGEKAAWKRLKDYFWEKDLLKKYKSTRNGLIGADYSSKLSPWLAIGAISAKSVYYEIKKYEAERTKNQSTYWLFFELLWRDFFKFMAKKHGHKIFLQHGLSELAIDQENNQAKFDLWRKGETQEPFIDANMKELAKSGFMSNRGRQIVASYLMHNLKVNWTWGAAWFEHALIDYDPASNWLNWAYIAGVGNDPRNGRVFNVESQQQRHDPKGEYINLWS